MARDERTGAYARNVSQEDWDLAHKMSKIDGFGFGIPQKSEHQLKNERIVKDHIHVWNRLIDNKGPIGMKKDELQWEGRAAQLMDDEAFRSFIDADTVQEKIVVLRDTGLGSNKQMSDEELGQFLMTHAPSGLTEDPNVSEQAIEIVEKEPFLKVGKLNKEKTDIEGDPYFTLKRTGTGLIDKINPNLKY